MTIFTKNALFSVILKNDAMQQRGHLHLSRGSYQLILASIAASSANRACIESRAKTRAWCATKLGH